MKNGQTAIPDALAYRNPEAERSVLGSALQDPDALHLMAEMESADFTEPAHRVIFQALAEMERKKTPVDLVTVDQKLSEENRIEIIGGTQYLMGLIAGVPTTVNVKAYIQIVRECTARRKLKKIGEALIVASGSTGRELDEIREKAAIAVRDVKVGGSVDLITQEAAVIKTFDKLNDAQRKDNQPEKSRIMTGIARLDKMTGGLYGSKLMIIGARPSVGKSIFAMTICMFAAKQGKRVLYITLEMEEDELMEREFAAESMVSLSEITSDEITPEGWTKLAETMGQMSKYPLWYCTGASHLEEVRKAAMHLNENGGIDLLCVDYIQLLETFKKRNSRQEEVSDISRGLKRLAQELKIPVIALSQLNRASARERRAPTMNDARESGAIEQDANIFLLLHDPDIEEMKTDSLKRLHKNLHDRGMKLLHVNVDKNRQGQKGMFYIAFDGDHMRFLSLSSQQEDPA